MRRVAKSSVFSTWAAMATIVTAALSGCGSDSGGPLTPSPSGPATTARYRVTFEASWSAATHPTDFPVSAHFSGLIGGTHDARMSLWAPGGTASDGIRNMAELGSKSPLDAEVNAAIASGQARFLLSGGGIGRSPGSVSLEFEMARSHPLVTLVSMIAPSPDWFVGVSGLSLVRDGNWVEELRVDLFPYDAGTDGGVTYLSPDQTTTPRQAIARIMGYPLGTNSTVTPLGTFTFRRLTN